MNDHQQIVVDKRLFSLYYREVNFLLHNELLREYASDKMQFIHQTFFDYVYSRTFISSENLLQTGYVKFTKGFLFVHKQSKFFLI